MNVCRCSTGENGFKDHEIIFVEPFYGGSHKQLIDTLHRCKIYIVLLTTYNIFTSF